MHGIHHKAQGWGSMMASLMFAYMYTYMYTLYINQHYYDIHHQQAIYMPHTARRKNEERWRFRSCLPLLVVVWLLCSLATRHCKGLTACTKLFCSLCTPLLMQVEVVVVQGCARGCLLRISVIILRGTLVFSCFCIIWWWTLAHAEFSFSCFWPGQWRRRRTQIDSWMCSDIRAYSDWGHWNTCCDRDWTFHGMTLSLTHSHVSASPLQCFL